MLIAREKTWDFQRDYFVRALKPTLAVDAGANIGQWATKFLQVLDIPTLSYEPDSRCHQILRNKSRYSINWTIREVGLGDKNEKIPFYEWDIEGGSSSYQKLTTPGERFTGWENFRTNTVMRETVLLDDELMFNDADKIWLKVDVQGYELPLLKGAKKILSKVIAVEIEIPLYEIYEGSSTFTGIQQFLEEAGFICVSIFTERWANPGAADCDALFVRLKDYNFLKKLKN